MSAVSRGSYRKYTPEQKKKAIKLALKVGGRRAASKLGVPCSTLAHWASKSEEASSGDGPPTHDVNAVPRSEAGIKEADLPSSDVDEKQGGTSKHVARRYTPSQKARALEYAAAHGVSEASKKLGISRYSIYDWRRKLARGEVVTTGPEPADEEERRDREILAQWKKHPGLGPSQIKNQLRREGVKVATNTVRRVMEDAGYRTPKVKHHKHDERYEAVRPNHMWHLDYVERYINRAKTNTLILIDDHSRFVVGHGVDDAERADFVIDVFSRAVERYGRPEMLMNDRGSAFWAWRGISRFTRLLDEMGIDQIVAKQKQLNGKSEVFNKNIQKELFDVHRFYDLAEMQRRLEAYLDWYNHKRTHHALGGLLVPADRYYGRVEEVMARIEAGGGTDTDIHTVDLRHREMELFRVIQNKGVPEVWLMGQKILALG